MTDEELIARLLDGCNLQQRDGERAAKRIEQLIATNEALIAERDEANKRGDAWRFRADIAEVKLAKAVEALQWCAMYGDGDVALATLAEIKGESHD